jgi:peptidoglycan/xylan/chitin deacetylase (PgdA/CDA1 family)
VPRAPEARPRRRSRMRLRRRPRVRAPDASLAHHRSAWFGAGAALGAIGAHALPAPAPLVRQLAEVLQIRNRLGDSRRLAITFDDGPHPDGTPAVLEVLDREGVAATFFLVGEQVRRNPSLAAEIVAAGHVVQLHGERHRNQLRLTAGQIRDDLRCGEEAIQQATGRATPALPPSLRDLLGGWSESCGPVTLGAAAVVTLGPRLEAAGYRSLDRSRGDPRAERRRDHLASRRRSLR